MIADPFQDYVKYYKLYRFHFQIRNGKIYAFIASQESTTKSINFQKKKNYYF